MKTTTTTAAKRRAPMDNATVILKRTFNQSDFHGGFIKFWRVVAPSTHRFINSDLSVEGLKDAGVILNKEVR